MNATPYLPNDELTLRGLRDLHAHLGSLAQTNAPPNARREYTYWRECVEKASTEFAAAAQRRYIAFGTAWDTRRTGVEAKERRGPHDT